MVKESINNEFNAIDPYCFYNSMQNTKSDIQKMRSEINYLISNLSDLRFNGIEQVLIAKYNILTEKIFFLDECKLILRTNEKIKIYVRNNFLKGDDYIDELDRITYELSAAKNTLKTFENISLSYSRSDQIKISDYSSVVNNLKPIILEIDDIRNIKLNEKHINKIIENFEHLEHLLFNKTNNNISLFAIMFELTEKKSDLIPLFKHILTKHSYIEKFIQDRERKENFNTLCEILFYKSSCKEVSIFETLMSQPNANELFDNFLLIMPFTESLNSSKHWLRQFNEFAFSAQRYEALFLKDEEILSKLVYLDYNKNVLKNISPHLRTKGSFSVKANSNSLKNWKQAEEWIDRLAESYKIEGLGLPLDLSFIKMLHEILTSNEPDVNHPGEFRKEVVRAAGGTYCNPSVLENRLMELENWLEEQFIACEKKEKKAEVFAIQIHQKIAALHPFENGNGRVAHLLMDYVLQCFNCPLAIFPENIIEGGAFPTKHSQEKREQYIQSMVQLVNSN